MNDEENNNSAAGGAGGNISALRGHLFEAIRAVRAGTLDLDKARAINELSRTIVETGKLEVDHARATGTLQNSAFIAPEAADEMPSNGITGIVRHRLAG